jgi:hypothetical protein
MEGKYKCPKSILASNLYTNVRLARKLKVELTGLVSTAVFSDESGVPASALDGIRKDEAT